MVSDPNTKGMHYGFGCSVSHGRKGKGMGGHTWRMVVAGEDLAKDGAARPVVAARKERPREGKRERQRCRRGTEKGNGRPPSRIRNRTVAFFFLRFFIYSLPRLCTQASTVTPVLHS